MTRDMQEANARLSVLFHFVPSILEKLYELDYYISVV
jgi:hypothetical protein